MKELWLCTRQYPKGRGEAFLQHALPVWKKQFSRVVVIPMFDGEGEFPVPDGIEVMHLWKDDEFTPLSNYATFANAPAVLRTVSRYGDREGRSRRYVLSLSRQLVRKAEVFRTLLGKNYDPEKVAVLSVWLEDWVTVLGLVKEREPRFRFSAMGHGWDLFEHRRASGNIPFRTYQLEAADQLLLVSGPGVDHIKEKYPHHAPKAVLARLGTPDHGMAPWTPAPALRIASCSYLRKPKRVDLLVEALAQVDRPVEWTHCGDGPDREEIQKAVDRLPRNIRTVMRGNTSNADVLHWYATHPVDVFIHLSDSEGLPIALMEAASFGIPLLANDVGGVSEIVTSSTGRLLSSRPNVSEVVDALQPMNTERLLSQQFRRGVRAAWQEGFNCATNYRRIGELL
ncbi:MAG: glycosyltransferase [Flavobacteriales bacterium]|nr:glycosyltransferase [Flavobacteriales bacterium]